MQTTLTKQGTTASRSSSRYIEPAKLQIINEQIADNIEEFFDYFGYSGYTETRGKIVGPCPIHEDSDGVTSFNMWVDGHTTRGNWKCRSHSCQEKWKGTAVGLVRGMLSKLQERDQTLFDAVKFASGLLNQNLDDIKIDRSKVEKKEYNRLVSYFNEEPAAPKQEINKEQVRRSLQIPSKYFMGRGYPPHILQRYDVGDCYAKGREMYLRAVAPIYDLDGDRMIGCTGRSFYDKCKACGMHHHSNSTCPEKNYYAIYCKWKHQAGFRAENYLYNLWSAAERIMDTGWAILVESPGNVWRLEEIGIDNSLGMFGTSLTSNQRLLLDRSGAFNILLLPDAGDAGDKSQNTLVQELGGRYNIQIHEPWWDDDVGGITKAEEKDRLAQEIKCIIQQ